MNTRITKVAYGLILTLLLTLAACTLLKIDPPSPEKQSLLVLPVTHTNKAENFRAGFWYVYEISSDNKQVAPYRAIIRFPRQHDMLIVDALPPGDYRVSTYKVLPVGSGDHNFSNNAYPLNEPFTLAPGMITILPKSFNLLTYNRFPGSGASTTYAHDIEPVTDEQRTQILNTLGQLNNFQSWKVLDTSNTRVLGVQGSWSGSWKSSSTDDCGNGELRVNIVGPELKGSGVSADGESLMIKADINDQGKIIGKLFRSQVLQANVSGGIYSGGEIAGKIIFLDGCESQWSILKKIPG